MDYASREELLAALRAGGPQVSPRALSADLSDGRCKLFLIWKVLQLRRQQPRLFSHGDYRALRARGSHATNVCAFARRAGHASLIVIAPRLCRRLLDDPARLPLGVEVWEDTLLELPREQGRGPLRNVLTGTMLEPFAHGNGSAVALGQALAEFPVALFACGDAAQPGTR